MKKIFKYVTGIAFCICTGCTELPTCQDGRQNGIEIGVDCGGECRPCFECLSEYCTLISGATSDKPLTHVVWECPWMYMDIESDGTLMVSFAGGKPGSGTWEFDDPESPRELIINFNYFDMPENSYYQEVSLIRKLSRDTLDISYGLMTRQN